MKLIYVAYLFPNVERYIGVSKKIRDQTEALSSLGVNIKTYLFLPSKIPNFLYSNNIKLIDNIPPIEGSVFKALNSMKSRYSILKGILNTNKFDLILFRYPLSDPFFISFLNKFSAVPVVTEHNDKELEGLKSFGDLNNKVRFFLEKLCAKIAFKKVKGLIGVTKEIVNYEIKRLNFPESHTEIISNGINVNDVPLSKRPFYDGKTIRILLIVSTFFKWHGLDRVLNGLQTFRSKKMHIELHIIGNISPFYKSEIERVKNAENIYLHGCKNSTELDALFNHCHLAIGSLGVHRIDLKEASTLKTREYLARGIPFIISYDDTDLDKDYDFYYKTSANDELLDFNQVIDFYEKIQKQTNINIRMREFALKKIDWKIKMKKLVSFLEKIQN